MLEGRVDVVDAIQPTHIPGLHVLVSGPVPENPLELLGPAATERVLAELSDYDLVMIDTPPVNVVSDALVLASIVDGVIFVVSSHKTTRHLVSTCAERLLEVNQNLLGTIVNKLDVKSAGYGYGYYYRDYYQYYAPDEANRARETG